MPDELPVWVQKWSDFMEGTKAYRIRQETYQKEISDKLENNQRLMFDKLDAMNKAILMLPCEARRLVYLADKKNCDTNIKALWIVIGTFIASVFLYWFNSIKH